MLPTRDPVLVLPSLSMTFTEEAWNGFPCINDVNCLGYAFNNRKIGKPYWTDFLKEDENGLLVSTNLPSLKKFRSTTQAKIAMALAGLERIRQHQYDPSKRHIIAYHPWMTHYFRLDGNKTWSHKQGATHATNLDYRQNVITNLEEADFETGIVGIGPQIGLNYHETIRVLSEINSLACSESEKQEILKLLQQCLEMEDPDAKNTIQYYALPEGGIYITPH